MALIVLVPTEELLEDLLLDPHDFLMVPWDPQTILVAAATHQNRAGVLQNLEEVLRASLEGYQGSQDVRSEVPRVLEAREEPPGDDQSCQGVQHQGVATQIVDEVHP